MSQPIESFGRDPTTGRDLHAWSASTRDARNGFPGEFPAAPFICLLVWDAATETVEAISAAVDAILGAGCVYLCTWGTDCERVHDICDEELVMMAIHGDRSDDGEHDVMTTWHANEPLEEALWFFLRSTIPFESYEETCRTGIVLAVDQNAERMSIIRNALTDPESFSRRIESLPDSD